MAPLRLEARALAKGAPSLRVERTGAGMARSSAAAGALSAKIRPSAVAVAGVAGGLRADLRPGTVVVADRVLAEDGSTVAHLDSAGLIATQLRERGSAVAVAPVISTRRIVEGADRRARLAATGAVAVDTETAWLLAAGWDVPAAVVRVIVDTPDRELRSARTVPSGIRALRELRAAAPAMERWGRAVSGRRVLLAEPRSFCAGVERAIATVERALEQFGAPVYVRRQIVHNRHVVAGLERKGAVFIDEVDDAPQGATVVISAHGAAPAVREVAAGRRQRVVDATCPLVAKVHHEVRRFSDRGYSIVLIGHHGHDETEGTLGEADDVTLVTRPADVETLDLRHPDRVAYLTQTTLAQSDVAGIVGQLSAKYPGLVGPSASDICYATQNRQDAVAAMAPECDLVLVVGSANSSNAARLVEVARRAGARAELVEDGDGLRIDWLDGAETVGVTAAASTPPELVDSVVGALGGAGPTTIEARQLRTENVSFPLPLEVR